MKRADPADPNLKVFAQEVWKGDSIQFYSSDGRGAYFNSNGTFRGFLDK